MMWYVLENINFMGIASGGWGNGYVAVPPSHVLYKKDYTSVFYLLEDTEYEIDIHGGLTYSDFGDGKNAPKNWWVFGFDTCHIGDTIKEWPKEAVEEETKRLFHQLFEIEWGEL